MAVFKFRNLKNGQAMPVPEGEFLVGRADEAYVHLEDSSVSRRHAQLINNEDGFFIEDLGSANGTAARGAYINQRVKIEYGDPIFVGSVPFRIDPEVVGEVETAPPVGVRNPNRAYIRRDTERLPIPGEAPREVETISPENLSAPAVPDTDLDSEEVNAITFRETSSSEAETKMERPVAPLAALPATQLPKQSYPLRQPGMRISTRIQPPTPQQAHPVATLPSTPTPRPTVAAPVVQEAPSPVRDAPPPIVLPADPTPSASTAAGMGWGWFLVVFMAGLGTGLLLGLYFAKLFLEMGGKPGMLP